MTRLSGAACGSAFSGTYGFDPFGNLTKSGTYSFQPTYSASTNRMTSLPGFTPTYDANGNVLSDSSHVYTWDAEGRPVTVDGVGLTFDALLRMVEQNRSGAYTEIVYAPTGEKLALMNGQSLVKAFVPLPGSSTAVYTATGLSYYRHPDWLGSNRLTSSPSRTVLSSIAYGPFGETYAQAGTVDPSFTGQNQDTSTGDYDFLFREYSTQGRWPSPDPAGIDAVDFSDPRSLNRYAYVLNDPLDLIDPLGLCNDGIVTSTINGVPTGPGTIFSSPCFGLIGGGGIFRWPCGGFVGWGCAPAPPPPPQLIDSLKAAWQRTKIVNQCAGELSQAGSVSSLSGGRVPQLLGSNTFGDIASLATGSGGFDEGGAVAADATAHTVPSIATQVAVGTATSIGRAVSHTARVYNPVTAGATTVTVGMTTIGKVALGAVEGVLTGKVLLDAGVYIGALVVCSEE